MHMKTSTRLRCLTLVSLVSVLSLGFTTSASAEETPVKKAAAPNESAALVQARQLFAKGASLVRGAQWAEALGAFEESNQLRWHPITTYNIGACERALGRYTVAQASLQKSLAPDPVTGARLPKSLALEAMAYLEEIERLLVHVELSVEPADATIAIDGRPLETLTQGNGKKVLVAGRRPAGRGERLPEATMQLLLDPGTHLFTLSRKGYDDRVVTKTFKPGQRGALELNLDKLPAKLRISSNERDAVVRVGLMDVGYAPVDVDRPAGAYRVSVEKAGFDSYETTVRVNPGEAADIKARLKPETITQKWWFWTAAGVLVSGAVVTTYFVTRSEPAPERPPLDGGGLGWTLEVP
jgi:hypothetical protein